MWLIAICVVCYGALWQFFSWFSGESWPIFVAVWFWYYLTGSVLHHYDALRWEAFRGGALAAWVKRHLARIRFSPQSTELLAKLDPADNYLFMAEPHGAECLHMALCFAAHGGELPEQLSRNTRIVAHHSARLIPFIRELYSALGVIDNTPEIMEEHMTGGLHLVVVPSGLVGKARALLDDTDFEAAEARVRASAPPSPRAPAQKPCVSVYRRTVPGCVRLAAQHNYKLVPVLSPDEPRAFSLWNRWLGLWPLVLIVGDWLVLPRIDMQVRVGEPIDCRSCDHKSEESLQALSDLYYARLVELAGDDYQMEIK